MLQLHLSDRQFYCLLRCVLYKRLDGITAMSGRIWHGHNQVTQAVYWIVSFTWTRYPQCVMNFSSVKNMIPHVQLSAATFNWLSRVHRLLMFENTYLHDLGLTFLYICKWEVYIIRHAVCYISMSSYTYMYEKCCARNRYQVQGQVCSSHVVCGV